MRSRCWRTERRRIGLWQAECRADCHRDLRANDLQYQTSRTILASGPLRIATMDCDAADEVFADLPLLERSLLWSMRCWVIGARASIDVSPPIARLFRQLHTHAHFAY